MKVLIAGDYCPNGRVSNYINNGDYSFVFSELQQIIQNVDYSIVNFECPVASVNDKPIEKQGPNLRCSTKGVEALEWAGFNCVTLANNHFLDYGSEGVRKTIEALDYYGIEHVGGGMNLCEASTILYKEINGEKLAIINCCENEFSIATNTTAGSNPLNPVQQYYTIREARSKADYVLIIVHGGHEHFQLPSPRMVETYRFFIDAGADAVVNHHQHCFSGYELWQGHPIFYGLGNFCFDDEYYHDGFWTEGYCVTLNFSQKKISFVLHPYKQCTHEPTIKILDSVVYKGQIDNLNSIISDLEALSSAYETYCDSSSKRYGAIFEPFYNRYFLVARYRGWLPSFISKKRILAAMNYVICESHRDILIRWLKQNK